MKTREENETTSTHQGDGFTVTFRDGPEVHKAAYETLLKWFHEQKSYSGESIHQTDDTYVEAPNLLTELAEKVFQFNTQWEE